MKELDVVRLINDHGDIKLGTKGTVVYKYDKNNFEVEFFDVNGVTIDVITINRKDIEIIFEY